MRLGLWNSPFGLAIDLLEGPRKNHSDSGKNNPNSSIPQSCGRCPILNLTVASGNMATIPELNGGLVRWENQLSRMVDYPATFHDRRVNLIIFPMMTGFDDALLCFIDIPNWQLENLPLNFQLSHCLELVQHSLLSKNLLRQLHILRAPRASLKQRTLGKLKQQLIGISWHFLGFNMIQP